MDKDKVVQKLDDKGHEIDDFVEKKAEKHGFTKFQTWLGLLIGAIAVIAIARFALSYFHFM